MSHGEAVPGSTLGEQIKELVSAIREKITTLTKELADAKKELAAARGAVVTPRRKSVEKKSGKGKKGGATPAPAV